MRLAAPSIHYITDNNHNYHSNHNNNISDSGKKLKQAIGRWWVYISNTNNGQKIKAV